MLSSNELHTLYEGLRLNSVNQYDYVLTGKTLGPVPVASLPPWSRESPPHPPGSAPAPTSF